MAEIFLNSIFVSLLCNHIGWISLFLLVTVACVILWRRNRLLRNIPGPNGHFLLGNTLDFSVSADHHVLLLKWARKYGGVFKYYVLFGGYRVHVTDPDIAKHVIVANCRNYRRQDVLKKILPGFGNGLITANGHAHALQRKQLMKFFTKARIEQIFPVFISKANELSQFWENELLQHENKTMDCDILEKLTHMTLDVIGLCAFGYSFDCISGGHSEESKATNTILTTSFDLQGRSFKQLFPFMGMWKSEKEKHFMKAEKCFRSLIDKIIKQRRNDAKECTTRPKCEQTLLDILTAISADKLGDYEIPAGTHVMVGIGTLHRLGSYWKDPDVFNPDRFNCHKGEKGHSLHYHFLPFSRGPRMCIGYRFAMAELKVTLAKLLSKFTFKLSSKQDCNDIKAVSTLTLKPFPSPILQMGLVDNNIN
eukprot:gene10929-12090_t